jgi:hypothetical protein
MSSIGAFLLVMFSSRMTTSSPPFLSVVVVVPSNHREPVRHTCSDRHSYGAPAQRYVPTVFDNFAMDIVVDGTPVSLVLWDTAGQEDMDRVRIMSYSKSDIVLLCFAVDDRKSMDNIHSKVCACVYVCCVSLSACVSLRLCTVAARSLCAACSLSVCVCSHVRSARLLRLSADRESTCAVDQGGRQAVWRRNVDHCGSED